MGKSSKLKKRALPRVYGILKEILGVSEVYFNDEKHKKIVKLCESGLGRIPKIGVKRVK